MADSPLCMILLLETVPHTFWGACAAYSAHIKTAASPQRMGLSRFVCNKGLCSSPGPNYLEQRWTFELSCVGQAGFVSWECASSSCRGSPEKVWQRREKDTGGQGKREGYSSQFHPLGSWTEPSLWDSVCCVCNCAPMSPLSLKQARGKFRSLRPKLY